MLSLPILDLLQDCDDPPLTPEELEIALGVRFPKDYTYLAFDIRLDGFITSAPQWTASEKWALEHLPSFHSLMDECAHAAEQCGNTDCLELVDEVMHMLKSWEEYLQYRERMIAGS
jgi:hypothetical protein